MLTDFYELTMAGGYFENGLCGTVAYFDMFFRRVPDNGGYAVMAGIEQVMDYINNLHFTQEDIAYLRDKGIFSEAFLDYLKSFSFTCDIWAVPEGKAVMEFGSRRAQGFDAAVLGARAAYIGGCAGTANVLADRVYQTPALGTMAHSWVQMFDSEFDAFKAYALRYPRDCTLLVDTYSTLKSGVPNAIRVFKEVLAPLGYRPSGIRIDSGDITYLSKKARKMLDEAGFPDCKICASNSLDEYLIRDMFLQGAPIDLFGVGERLITASSEPVFGGVYKLAAVEKDGEIVPKIKISDNVSKITTPCFKDLYRLYDRASGKAIADVVTLFGEEIEDQKPYELFDPQYTWKRKTVTDFRARKLRVQLFKNGKPVYQSPALAEIKKNCALQLETLWDEVKRFENPHNYYVDLSQRLWEQKEALIKKNKV